MPRICLKEQSHRTSWSRFTCKQLQGTRTLISATQSATWGGPRSSSSLTPRDPHNITRGPTCHPLPHLAAACRWTLVPQTHTPNLVGRGFNATTVRGLVISHANAHSHTGPSNNSRPSLHSNKEAILMTRESMLCTGCPLQKCRTSSRILRLEGDDEMGIIALESPLDTAVRILDYQLS